MTRSKCETSRASHGLPGLEEAVLVEWSEWSSCTPVWRLGPSRAAEFELHSSSFWKHRRAQRCRLPSPLRLSTRCMGSKGQAVGVVRFSRSHGNAVSLIQMVQVLFRRHMANDHTTVDVTRTSQIIDVYDVTCADTMNMSQRSHVNRKMLDLDVIRPYHIMSREYLLAP